MHLPGGLSRRVACVKSLYFKYMSFLKFIKTIFRKLFDFYFGISAISPVSSIGARGSLQLYFGRWGIFLGDVGQSDLFVNKYLVFYHSHQSSISESVDLVLSDLFVFANNVDRSV